MKKVRCQTVCSVLLDICVNVHLPVCMCIDDHVGNTQVTSEEGLGNMTYEGDFIAYSFVLLILCCVHLLTTNNCDF